MFPQNRCIDMALNCSCWASLYSRTFLKFWNSLGSSVCAVCCLSLQCLPFPCSPCLWGSPMLWGPIQLACDSSACSFSPAPFPFFLLTSAELEGCRLWGPVHAPQEYQKAGNLHFNNSLIMYLSDPVNILHFLNFADCRHCGLSSQ